MLKGKHIILGISGGIAAYKSAVLIRLLKKAGAEVRVVATLNALQFVTKVTLETLSQNKLYCDLFGEDNDYTTEHVSHSDWGDICIVAPATANIIGKFAAGIADNALSTLLLAFNKKIFLAPAMNCKMYEHFVVQKNLKYLKENGIEIIEPSEGFLACGYKGKGRMEEPGNIISFITKEYGKKAKLEGKTAIVTAGPTYEAIDPVRFIGNHSSGLMGFSIAEELANNGAKVTLITGPANLNTSNSNIKRIDVISSDDMFRTCIAEFGKADIMVMAAAVADYTPEKPAQQKIKKTGTEYILKLKPSNDILCALGKMKRKSQLLVGFALETNNETEHARNKLQNKNLDFIVLNSLKDKGAGFGYSTNKISIIDRNNKITKFDLKHKSEVAKDIVKKIIELIN